jgi:hypothetical protein
MNGDVWLPFPAPIIAFELNSVGPANSANSVLSSGAGTISYGAFQALTVLNQVPACAEPPILHTAETANSIYDALPAFLNNRFTQTFSIGPESGMIKKRGAPRRRLSISPKIKGTLIDPARRLEVTLRP